MVPSAPGPTVDSFRAGVGKAVVDLPHSLFPVDGFTSVRDPLQARVLVLDDSATRLALCVIDQTSVFDDQIARTRDILRRVCSVEPSHCLVVASHRFSAPHIVPPEHDRAKNALLGKAVDKRGGAGGRRGGAYDAARSHRLRDRCEPRQRPALRAHTARLVARGRRQRTGRRLRGCDAHRGRGRPSHRRAREPCGAVLGDERLGHSGRRAAGHRRLGRCDQTSDGGVVRQRRSRPLPHRRGT